MTACSRRFASIVLATLAIPTAVRAAEPWFAKPPATLIPSLPASPWKNVGFASWVDGYSGAQGVFIAVDVDPSNHDRILTATQLGGLWLSENAGKSWKNVDFDIAGLNDFRAIHFVRDQPSIAYAASAFGVMRSTDGGRTWKKLSHPLIDRSASYPSDPFNTHAVFFESALRGEALGLGNSAGLCLSRDGGTTWNKVFSKPVTSFKFKPGNPDVIYLTALRSGNINAANWLEFHRSEDGGKTWQEITAGLPAETFKNKKEQFALAFIRTTPKFPERIYLMGFGANYDLENKHDVPSMWAMRDKPSGPLCGVKGFWISDDAGKTFKNVWNQANDVLPPAADRPNLTTNLETVNLQDRTKSRKFYVSGLHQGAWDMVFEISEENPDLMVCGGQSPWITTDGGKSWKYHHETQAEADPSIKGDGSPLLATRQHWFHGDFQCCRIIGEKIWMGNDGGLVFSGDKLRTINTIDIGTTGVEPWGFDMSWQDPDVMLIACNHGPVHLKYPKLWGDDWINMGGGDSSQCFANPADVSVAYGPWRCVHFLPATQGGDSRREVKTHGLGGNLFHSIASPFDARSAYALFGQRKPADGKGSELVLFNGKQIEKALRTFPSEIHDLTTAHTVPGFIFLTEGGRLWLSRDNGADFKDVSPQQLGSAKDSKTEITPFAKLGYQIKLVAADQTTAKVLYAAGRVRNQGFVLSSSDDGVTWTDITGSLYSKIGADGEIKDLECQAGTEAGLYAVTASRIAYRSAVMTDWKDLSAGLPAANVINYVKTAPALGLLRVCSNKGVFERPLAETSRDFVWVRADQAIQYPKKGPYTVKWFDVSSTDRKASYRWRFPGGKPAVADGTAVAVTYDQPGNYDAFLDIKVDGQILSWSARTVMKLGTQEPPKVPGAVSRLDFTAPGQLEAPLGSDLDSDTLLLAARITPLAPLARASIVTLANPTAALALTLDPDGHLGVTRAGAFAAGPQLDLARGSHVAASFEPAKVRFFVDGKAAGEAPLPLTGRMTFAKGDALRFSDTAAPFLGGLDDVLLLPGTVTAESLATIASGNTGSAPDAATAYYDFNALIDGSRFTDLASGETFCPASASSLIADARLQSAFAEAARSANHVAGSPPLAGLRFTCSKAELFGKVGVAKPKIAPDADYATFMASRHGHALDAGDPSPVRLGGEPPLRVPETSTFPRQ